MTQPYPRSGLTPEQALLAARTAVQARTPARLATMVAERASEAVIATRERAARWAKRLISSLWAPVDPYNGNAVAEFTQASAKTMAIAQKATATAAAAGQKQILSTMGVQVTPRPADTLDVRARAAVFTGGRVHLQRDDVSVDYASEDTADISAQDFTTVEIFNRPARTLRYLESQGADRDQAEKAAGVRMDTLIDDNLMLAQRLAEFEVINLAADQPNSPLVGMRRIVHPELSRTGVCGLCIAAADRLYTVRELLPIHDRCKCTSAPVTEDFDPADELNQADLRQLYDDAGGTSRAHLKRVRYQEDQHGELGPVLKPDRSYKPRGPGADKRSAATYVGGPESKADIARRHLPGLEQNLAKLRAEGLSEESPQIRYHKETIARMRDDISAAENLSSRARPESTPAAIKGMKAKR